MKTRRKHYKNYDVDLHFECLVQEVFEDLEWNSLEEFLEVNDLELIFYKTNKKQNVSISISLYNYLEEEI